MSVAGRFAIEVRRGGVVESKHDVHAVIADRNGKLRTWGDPGRPTIARSAIKSIQAIPIITTGAADAYSVSPEELALACASHSAEREHVDAITGWLDRLELDESDLECGADLPIGVEARKEFLASGEDLRPIYNGCSGKHTGFLTVHRHLGVETAGYIEPEAPAQRLVTESIEAFTGLDLSDSGAGRDGCGIPVFAIPLERLAFAMARLVDPVDVSAELAAAASTIVDAAQLAFWVSGRDRTEVEVVDRASEPVVIKTGAEGVFMVGLPDRGLGIALKVEDGRSRAARAAVRGILELLGAIEGDDILVRPVNNKAGIEVGEIRASIGPDDTASLAPAL